MTINLNITVTADDKLQASLGRIEVALQKLQIQETTIMANLDTLTAQVKANTDVESSAVTLLNGLSAQLAAVANDPVAVKSLADSLKTSADSLAAAVVANTPAA
jgi:hypothetical protein